MTRFLSTLLGFLGLRKPKKTITTNVSTTSLDLDSILRFMTTSTRDKSTLIFGDRFVFAVRTLADIPKILHFLETHFPGTKAEVLTGSVSTTARSSVWKDFENGEFQHLIIVEHLVMTGVRLPKNTHMVFPRPITSNTRFEQALGRVRIGSFMFEGGQVHSGRRLG